MKKPLLFFLSGCFLLTQTACFGSFEAVKKVYKWNENVSDSGFVQTIVMYVFMFIPVYSIAGFLDIVIFNLIEFWSGSNPMAMNEGEIEQQTITINNQDYLVTATKNKFDFQKLNGEEAEAMGALVYSETNKKWSFENNGETVDIVKINDDQTLTYYTEQGELNVAMEEVAKTSVLMNNELASVE